MKAKNGVATLNLSGIPANATRIYIYAQPMVKNGKYYDYGNDAHLLLTQLIPSWNWTTAPKVTVTQATDREGYVLISFNDTATFDVLSYQSYVVTTPNGTKTYTRDELSFNETTNKFEIYEPWKSSFGSKAAVTVTSKVTINQGAYYGTDAGVVYRNVELDGKAGKATYNSSKFVEAQWKTAPTVQVYATKFADSIIVSANTDMAVDGYAVYLDGVINQVMTNEATDHGEAECVIDIADTKKHTVKVCAVQYKRDDNGAIVTDDDKEPVISDYGTFSKETKIAVTQKPDWQTKFPTISAKQVNDDYVTLTWKTFTNDAYGQLFYEVTDNGVTVEKTNLTYTGSKTVLTIAVASDDQKHEFKVTAYAYDDNNQRVDGVTGTATIKKLSVLWKAQPTVKVSYDATEPEATVKVTCKGSPDSVKVEYSLDGKDDTWDPEYTEHITPDQDGSFTFELTGAIGETYYMRVTPCKGEEEETGTTSKVTKISFLPKWATTNLKPKLTRSGENSVTAKWSAVKGVDGYSCELYMVGVEEPVD